MRQRFGFVNFEFIAKLDHNRIRIPSKFYTIEPDDQIEFAFAEHTVEGMGELSKPYFATVKNKRIISITDYQLVSTNKIFIFIYRLSKSQTFPIERTIQSKITAKGYFKIPKNINVASGDRVLVEIEKNITKNYIILSTRKFLKVTKERSIKLSLGESEYSPRDRIQVKILEIRKIPSNLQINDTNNANQLNNNKGNLQTDLPIFLPSDLIDRSKYSTREASILSIIMSRLLDGKESTTLGQFEEYASFENLQDVLSNLQNRGIVTEKIGSDDQIVYAFPKFVNPSISSQLNNQQSLLIIVHSFGGGVSKTTFSCNLANTLAQKGLKTIIVDFDFVNSRLGSIFNLLVEQNISYLNDYFTGLIPKEELILNTNYSNLDVIITDPEGDLIEVKSTDQGNNLRNFRKITQLMQHLKNQYDIIIIDAEGSLDYNIINGFMLSDISFILSNSNTSSLRGLINRSKLILQRTGINVRNDYLIHSLVPETRKTKAIEKINEWKRYFEKIGITVVETPLIDELRVKEQIFDDNYIQEEDTKLVQWINSVILQVPRIKYWQKLQ